MEVLVEENKQLRLEIEKLQKELEIERSHFSEIMPIDFSQTSSTNDGHKYASLKCSEENGSYFIEGQSEFLSKYTDFLIRNYHTLRCNYVGIVNPALEEKTVQKLDELCNLVTVVRELTQREPEDLGKERFEWINNRSDRLKVEISQKMKILEISYFASKTDSKKTWCG